MRDSKGRFVCGHDPLTLRDGTTGRFIKKSMVKSEDEYEKKSKELNEFFKRLETENKD